MESGSKKEFDNEELAAIYSEISSLSEKVARLEESTNRNQQWLEEIEGEVDSLNERTERNTYGVAVGAAIISVVSAWLVENVVLAPALLYAL